MTGKPATRRHFLGCLCCAGGALGVRAAWAAADPGAPTALELGVPNMQRVVPGVWVAQIAPSLWLHTTSRRLQDGTIYPCNGLILERAAGAVLIDTTNAPSQARALLDWSRARGQPITLGVATHFHDDRTGGIQALRDAGIRTRAHPLTRDLSRANATPMPDAVEFHDDVAAIDPALDLFYPGAGHTRDNIVAWLPNQRVLFGGCLVKSITTDDLGYVADAVLRDWPATLRRLRARYPAPAITVPGHGTLRGDPIAATQALLAKA